MRYLKNSGWPRLSSLLLLILLGCVEEYNPPVTAAQTALLVVDGFINSQGVTTIKLSRTVSLGEAVAPPPETQARVFVEDAAGRQLPLLETSPGTYVSAATTLDPTQQYHLRLRTAAGQQYASDPQPVPATPPSTYLYWTATNDGAAISVDAQAAPDAPRFYQWEFVETWEFTAAFFFEYRV